MSEMQTEVEKRPREYAAEILQLRDRADRADALQAVPEHLQAMVRLYVEITFSMRARR